MVPALPTKNDRNHYTKPRQFGLVPILDIPQMTDERWQELARERRAAGKGVPA